MRQKKENLSVFLKATRAQDAIVSTVHRWASASQKDVNLTNIDLWKQSNFLKKGSTNAQYEFPNKCSYTHLHLRVKQETSAQPQHKERK